MQNNPHENEDLCSEVDIDDVDDDIEPRIAQAISYLKARIKTKQTEMEDKHRTAPQSHAFADIYNIFLHMIQMLKLQYEMKNAQRNIQKLQSSMDDNTESLMESILHEQQTEQQVEMLNMMIDNILDYWLLMPLRLLLPQVVKDDVSKLIVGIGSMFGSDKGQSFAALPQENDEINQFSPN
ncbi:MAG: hypothetical protein EBQ95_04810 [Gammaproteobacteria bacterium]|nr:hypothetical protein [Gammaproteobacteria bacterium]